MPSKLPALPGPTGGRTTSGPTSRSTICFSRTRWRRNCSTSRWNAAGSPTSTSSRREPFVPSTASRTGATPPRTTPASSPSSSSEPERGGDHRRPQGADATAEIADPRLPACSSALGLGRAGLAGELLQAAAHGERVALVARELRAGGGAAPLLLLLLDVAGGADGHGVPSRGGVGPLAKTFMLSRADRGEGSDPSRRSSSA